MRVSLVVIVSLLHNPFAYSYGNLLIIGTLGGEMVWKTMKSIRFNKVSKQSLKMTPVLWREAKFAFSEGNLCSSGRVPGGLVLRPWCVTSALHAALHPCPPPTSALPTHTDTAGGRVSEQKESKAEEREKKCFSGSDVWESNERPRSNPVARQPKWYAEGISLKLESKQSLWISKPTTGWRCAPTPSGLQGHPSKEDKRGAQLS
jgi:hypothetical protein